MVERPKEKIPNGAIVNIVERSGQWVGRGIYNGHSRIALRLLSDNRDEPIDDAFFAHMIEQAVKLRRETLQLDDVTDAYRVVYSEGDGLSGLVVDRFGKTIVIEFFSAGMFKLRELIRDCLAQQFPGSDFYWFAEQHVAKQESFDCYDMEPPKPGIITEHGLKFHVAPGSKHKTGFFVDQRDNRQRLASFCNGKKVLDLCCNSGGFAIYAKAMGQAAEAVGVDLDEEVLELAKQNAKLNNVDVRFIQADLFTWLRDILPNANRYDVVVLDPAKLTRDRDSVDLALRKYLDMNRLAMQAVAPGGILLTCSCTGLVKEPDFLEMLKRAAWQARRTVQILAVTGAGSDHPYMVHVPEGRYLKAVFCKVL